MTSPWHHRPVQLMNFGVVAEVQISHRTFFWSQLANPSCPVVVLALFTCLPGFLWDVPKLSPDSPNSLLSLPLPQRLDVREKRAFPCSESIPSLLIPPLGGYHFRKEPASVVKATFVVDDTVLTLWDQNFTLLGEVITNYLYHSILQKSSSSNKVSCVICIKIKFKPIINFKLIETKGTINEK